MVYRRLLYGKSLHMINSYKIVFDQTSQSKCEFIHVEVESITTELLQ